MTTAMSGDDAPIRRRPWHRRALTWVAHYLVRSVIPLLGVALVAELVSEFTTGWVYAAASLIAEWATSVAICSVLVMHRHENDECERCVWQRLTENPTEAADAKLAWLRVYHFVFDSPRNATAMVAIGAGAVLLSDVTHLGPLWHWLLWSVWALWVGGESAVCIVHGWHQPWCRFCRRRRDDDDEQFPEWTPPPDPTEEKTPTPTLVRLR